MSENNLYYIYIDSKIEGTIDQLTSYFETDIFNADDCICVYFKYYKDIEKYIKNRLGSRQIKYKFIRKNSDLDFSSNKVVFYLFNAQSNCKITARRDLTHIFVTHGESHKLASIKPIIRIYDFVITSGQVGIERFLKASIFNPYNIQHEHRVLTMGDTFIGQNAYVFASDSQSLLYAPTWEGGIPEENYSSIGVQATKILSHIIQQYGIKKLYIQLHPNLGHRDKEYFFHFKKMMNELKKSPVEIVLVKSQVKLADHWLYRGYTLISQSYKPEIKISAAVTDISAMEMQLINKKIPTLVLFEQDDLNTLIIPRQVQYLYATERSLQNFNIEEFSFLQQKDEIQKHYDYLIGYCEENLRIMSFRQRIQWLCKFAYDKKIKNCQKNLELY
ncbi:MULTISPECIES: hypothetical protein [unclassified Acinetobacter]|uniref:hypothetical protein n=1 Tax=unclassified Acinetobacter TaxID=196816 RepID=UPI001C22F941|nr:MULTISPECIES: hypothetical protein [unclassified Acinetobacter]